MHVVIKRTYRGRKTDHCLLTILFLHRTCYSSYIGHILCYSELAVRMANDKLMLFERSFVLSEDIPGEYTRCELNAISFVQIFNAFVT